MQVRENELHATDDWIAAVEQARKALALPGESFEKIPIGWHLQRIGWETILRTLQTSFRAVTRQTGLSDRYLEYFASCIVSDFDADSPHQLPVWLAESLQRWYSASHPLRPGSIRLTFTHRLPADGPSTSQDNAESPAWIRLAVPQSARL